MTGAPYGSLEEILYFGTRDGADDHRRGLEGVELTVVPRFEIDGDAGPIVTASSPLPTDTSGSTTRPATTVRVRGDLPRSAGATPDRDQDLGTNGH